MSSHSEVRALLEGWSDGDREAFQQLIPLVVGDLRKIAHNLLARERRTPTLQTTELVSEVYLRLCAKRSVQWSNVDQFFGEMANIIRNILVDRARSRLRHKRGAGVRPVSIDQLIDDLADTPERLMDIDLALDELSEYSKRQSQVVELRFFVGLMIPEIAAVLGTSERTVKREWSAAKLWLQQHIDPE